MINDFWGCVASAVLVKDGNLYWGVIGDCEVAVFGNDGNLKFRSPNSMDVFENAVKSHKVNFKWEKPEGRKLIRSQFRNNSNQIINRECISFGVFTGEESAEDFIYTGDLKLSNGDLVLLYSDGFTPTIFHQDFFISCYSNNISKFEQKLVPFNLGQVKIDPKKFGKERTLLGFIYHD